MTRCILFLSLLITMCLPATLAQAQAYPTRPLRLIIGQPPGAIQDVAVRLVNPKLAQALGQPVVVENRVGANGTISANLVIKATPDGYTLWFGNAAGVHPMFNAENSSTLGRELLPVTNVASVPFILYTSGKLPVKTLAELVAYAKAQPPGKLNFAPIIAQHELLMHLLNSRTGITYTSIPYKQGGAPAIVTALISGEIDFAIAGMAGVTPHLPSNAIRALMITSAKRAPAIPDVQTATELGIANYETESNIGVAAPVGTPAEAIRRVSTDLARIVRDAEIGERFRAVGIEPVGSTPEGQQRTYDAEMKLWAEAVRISNFKP